MEITPQTNKHTQDTPDERRAGERTDVTFGCRNDHILGRVRKGLAQTRAKYKRWADSWGKVVQTDRRSMPR